MDYRVFDMHTDVTACDCIQGCTDTIRESALKVDSGRKILCRSRELNLHWRRASWMLYRLSYIPTHGEQVRQKKLEKKTHKSFAIVTGSKSFLQFDALLSFLADFYAILEWSSYIYAGQRLKMFC